LYNTVHRHSGIALMTPVTVHYGTAAALTQQRAVTLDVAFAANPIRFKGLAPKPLQLPTAAWINPPKKDSTPIKITPACSLIS
jgi:putative transposase